MNMRKNDYSSPEIEVFRITAGSIICGSPYDVDSVENEEFENTDSIFNW